MKAITLVNISMSFPRAIPTGLLYIAAVLDNAGYKVDFKDYGVNSYRDLDPKDLISNLENSSDIIGISCISDSIPFVMTTLKQFKMKHPEKIIVLGGPGPTGVAKEIITHFPFIDIVVVGEGERTILEVMDCLGNGGTGDLRHVKGICYRNGKEACSTPPRERIRDLDALPFPLYDMINMHEYPLINIVFSRGCPYQCTFCDVAPMWQRKHYRRSIDSVMAELELLWGKYEKQDFEFTDETFVLRQDEILKFCERLKSDRLDVRWACTGRVDLTSNELLTEMASSGCRAIFYGIESGSDAVLEKIKKNFTVSEAVEAIHKTQDYVKIVASFIWGFPFETKEDLVKTLFLITYLSQIGVDCRLNRLAPFALAPLYEEYSNRLLSPEERSFFSTTDPFKTLGYRSDIVDLIRKMPKVFPNFYWLPTDHLEEKIKLVDMLSHHSLVMDSPWSCESIV